MNSKLQEMLDHHEIRKTLGEYCHACDRCDEKAMAAVYADESWDDHGVIQAPGPEFSSGMCEMIRTGTHSLQHMLGQSLISVDGDTAGAETYFMAVSRETGEDRIEMCNQLGGRFIDRLVRVDDRWLIKSRTVLRDWSVAIPVEHDWALSNTLKPGLRSNEDPSYAALGLSHGDLTSTA